MASEEGSEGRRGSEAGTGVAAPTTTAPVPLPPCPICRGHELNRLVPHEHDCPAPGRRAVVELIDSEWVASCAALDQRDPGSIAADALADPENARIVDGFINEIRRNR